jgi:GxxExxY protein
MEKWEYEFLAKKFFIAALEVHKQLGPGLLESVYVYALIKELQLMGINVKHQLLVPLFYKGCDTGKQFFIDLLVEDEIVLEVKSGDGILPVHEAQLVTYLKLANKKLGFLINFNVVLLKTGFKRRVNDYFRDEETLKINP